MASTVVEHEVDVFLQAIVGLIRRDGPDLTTRQLAVFLAKTLSGLGNLWNFSLYIKYGPNLPKFAFISPAVCFPTIRGSESNVIAASRVIAFASVPFGRDERFGFLLPSASSTYGETGRILTKHFALLHPRRE